MNGLGKIDLCYSVTFDRLSPHSPSRIWSAVTDPQASRKRIQGVRERRYAGAISDDSEPCGPARKRPVARACRSNRSRATIYLRPSSKTRRAARQGRTGRPSQGVAGAGDSDAEPRRGSYARLTYRK